MNSYWTKSLILHVGVVVVLALSGLSFCARNDPPQDMAVTVELMPIGAIDNVKPAPKQEKVKPMPQKKKEEKPQEEKPKEEKPKEKPKETTPTVDKAPPKEEKPKEEPKKEEPKPVKEASELDELLKTLEDNKPAPKVESQETENTDAKSQSVKPVDMNAPLTITEISYIKALIQKQIYPCWNVPAGARDAANLQIKLDVDVERDGTIRFAGFADESRYYSDNYYQVAADSARRAVLDPKCNPLKQLPPMDKFDKWHQLTITFDPSQLIR